MTDNEYTYRKLNVRPDQLQDIKLIATIYGISMIDLVDKMLADIKKQTPLNWSDKQPA